MPDQASTAEPVVSVTPRYDMPVENGTVLLPEAGRLFVNICIQGGEKTAALTTEPVSAASKIDASGLYVFPGIIDPHTHLGLFAPLETELETETRSAVLGGVTTIGTFFNRPDSYLPLIRLLEEKVPDLSHVDIFPHLTLREEAQLTGLPHYCAKGITSFKVYMCGIPGLFPHQEDGFIVRCMRKLSELPADPILSESEAVVRTSHLSKELGFRTYLVHTSCLESMEALQSVKHEKLFVETTSPYLSLDTESGTGVYGKMLPPFRTPKDRQTLWDGIRTGIIDTIGTDSTTITCEEKQIAGGMASAVAGYPALGTHLVSVLNEGFFPSGNSPGKADTPDDHEPGKNLWYLSQERNLASRVRRGSRSRGHKPQQSRRACQINEPLRLLHLPGKNPPCLTRGNDKSREGRCLGRAADRRCPLRNALKAQYILIRIRFSLPDLSKSLVTS